MAAFIELVDDELIKLEGKHRNSSRYFCRDHIFHKSQDDNCNIETYTCSQASHPLARCKVKIKRIAGKLILDMTRGKHLHKSSPCEVKLVQMKTALKEASKYPGTPQVIYDRVAPKHEDAALVITPKQVENIVLKERKNKNCRISGDASLKELTKSLALHEQYKRYFQVCLEPGNGDPGTVLVFAHEKALNHLNNAQNLYFDGNFKVVPEKPESMQTWNVLMTEHGSEKTEKTLVCFAWCTNATQGTYTAILSWLKSRAPQMERKVEKVFTDFEQAAILAFHYMLPNARIIGCWFHYSQAITKHWNDLELVDPKPECNDGSEEIPKRKKAPFEILYLCRNLPLLPADKIEAGLQYMGNFISKYTTEWPDLIKFDNYVMKQWGDKGHLLSNFGSISRTNNDSETFNRSLLRRIGGKHPTLSDFLFNMHNIITVEAQNMDKKFPIHRVTNEKKRHEKNQLVLEKQDQLINEEITVAEFLYEVMTEKQQEDIMKMRTKEIDENIFNKQEIFESTMSTRRLVISPEKEQPHYGVKPAKKKRRTERAGKVNPGDQSRRKQKFVFRNAEIDESFESTK